MLLTLLLMTLLLLGACVGQGRYRPVLDDAAQLVNDRPDSVVTLLRPLEGETSHFSVGTLMRYHLLRLMAENKCRTVFRSDSLQRVLTDYYDRHGTPNERMAAYYLLGRVNYYMGDAPQAMRAYHHAIEAADTTSVECDYWNLCRVYAQLSMLYNELNMPREMLSVLDLFHHCALIAGDTISSILAEAKKATAYEILDMADSVIYFSEKAARDFNNLNREDLAAQALSLSICQDIVKGNIDMAQKKIKLYEKNSGYFDEEGNIEKGRQIYYHSKGTFFLAKGQPDSAKIMFRKLLSKASDMNERHGAYEGLKKTYQLIGPEDSLVKYALLSEAYNDSVYQERYHDNLQRTQKLLAYDRHLRDAKRFQSEANKKSRMLRYLSTVLIFIILSCYLYYSYLKRKRVRMKEKYEEDAKKMKALNAELRAILKIKDKLIEATQGDIKEKEEVMSENKFLKSQLEDVKKVTLEIVEAKNEEIQKLKEQMDRQYAAILSTSRDELESQLRNSRIVHAIQKRVESKDIKMLSEKEWNALERLFDKKYPNFSLVLKEKKVSHIEYRVCMLIRIGITPLHISRLLNVDKSYISNIRTRLHKKVLGKEGRSADFDKFLSSIHFF